MTVAELIVELQKLKQTAEVVIITHDSDECSIETIEQSASDWPPPHVVAIFVSKPRNDDEYGGWLPR